MPSPRITVKPEVLAWARRSAGLDEITAAKRVGISRARLEQWEAGTRAPTLVQLRKAAKTYRRPLAVLLLEKPPNESGFDALADFRATGIRPRQISPELLAELRRVTGQREVMLELQSVSPDSVPRPTVLPQLSLDSLDIDESGQRLRAFAGVGLSVQMAARDAGTALNLWIDGIESAGVMVVHTRGVAPAEMHGFSISEWPYPIIALNGSDWPRRRLFTLLHELAHLSLAQEGICDLHESPGSTARDPSAIESLCNALAASTLLPKEALLDEARPESGWTLDELDRLSRRFGPSSEAILLRLIDLREASWSLYWERKPELDRAYEEAREREKEKMKRSDSKPPYFILKARDLGHGYATSVLDAYHGDRLSSLDVSDYLDIRFSQLAKLEAVIR